MSRPFSSLKLARLAKVGRFLWRKDFRHETVQFLFMLCDHERQMGAEYMRRSRAQLNRRRPF